MPEEFSCEVFRPRLSSFNSSCAWKIFKRKTPIWAPRHVGIHLIPQQMLPCNIWIHNVIQSYRRYTQGSRSDYSGNLSTSPFLHCKTGERQYIHCIFLSLLWKEILEAKIGKLCLSERIWEITETESISQINLKIYARINRLTQNLKLMYLKVNRNLAGTKFSQGRFWRSQSKNCIM